MTKVPCPDRTRKSFSTPCSPTLRLAFRAWRRAETEHRAQLRRSRRQVAALTRAAGSADEVASWRHADQQLVQELRELAPARQCASRRPAPARQARRAGCRRSPRSPRRGHGGTPPPSEPGGSDGDGGDGDPPDEPPAISDSDAIKAMARIMGTVMPDDRDIAACIVNRIKCGDSATRDKGIMQLAFAIWSAGIDGVIVDTRDVCLVLDVTHVSSATFPVIAIALGCEFTSNEPTVINSQRAGGMSS